MAFRYEHVSAARNELPDDPLARFAELYAAFDDSRRFFEDKAPIRFAAVTLVTTPGEASSLVAGVREREAELGRRLGFFSGVAPALRIVLSAVLYKRGDGPEAFTAAFETARALFRAHQLRRSEVFELLCFTILRGQAGNAHVSEAQVVRVKAIYAALRSHHYWLTGPEDLPACAVLAGTGAEASEIGLGAEAVYQALHKRAGWWPGERLHTASHIMYLSGVAPEIIVQRAVHLCTAFRDAGHKVRGADYENVSLLCFLGIPVERIVDTVLANTQRVRELLALRFGKRAAFNLAVSLTFVQLLQGDADLERLSDVKTLLDMQSIIAAQQAAAASAAT